MWGHTYTYSSLYQCHSPCSPPSLLPPLPLPVQSYGVPFGTEWSDPVLWVADTFPWVEWRSRDKLQNITEEDVGLSHGEGGGGEV